MDITTTRWMDGYGTTLPQVAAGELEGFEADLSDRLSSQAISITTFYVAERRCFDEVTTDVDRFQMIEQRRVVLADLHPQLPAPAADRAVRGGRDLAQRRAQLAAP